MKLFSIAAVLISLFGAGVQADEPVWDKKKAAARLEARALSWINKGSKLATDATGGVTCLSCHTTVPYALARPALRKNLGESAVPVLDGLLKDVDRRLVAWPAVTHMYEFDAEKKMESKGTEAVLSALMLAWNDDAHGVNLPTVPTKRALDRLWETQRADGGWDWLRFTLEPWEPPPRGITPQTPNRPWRKRSRLCEST
jgi:squalene-hopene/tetraprenyl-beta-curcumene cyclase